MTVVVALHSSSGIVLAADSQETSGQTRTLMRKLFDVDGRLVWGAAGDTSLTERLAAHGPAELLAHVGGPPYAVADQIRALTTRLQRAAVGEHVDYPETRPPQMQALFGWWDPHANLPRLYQIEIIGSGSFRHFRAAIGSGGPFAQVALATVAHLNTHELDLERLKMVAFKAVQDVILASAWGVGFPIQMYTITPDGQATSMSTEDLNGIRDSVTGWMQRQREILGELAPQPAPVEAEEIPDPGIEPDGGDQ